MTNHRSGPEPPIRRWVSHAPNTDLHPGDNHRQGLLTGSNRLASVNRSARRSEFRSRPLARSWRIFSIEPKWPRLAGRAALVRDFFRLIGDVPQIVAAQGSPAFLLLLGNSVDRAADTRLTGFLTLC